MQNVKEHAPSPAGASGARGETDQTTGEPANKAAGDGCVSRLARASASGAAARWLRANYTNLWDYDTVFEGKTINRGRVAAHDIGGAMSAIDAEHPELRHLIGALTSTRRVRKNVVSRLVVWFFQSIRSAANGLNVADNADRLFQPSPQRFAVGVVKDFVPENSGVGVDLNVMHKA